MPDNAEENLVSVQVSLTPSTYDRLDMMTDPYIANILELAGERNVAEVDMVTLYALLIVRLSRDVDTMKMVNGLRQGITLTSQTTWSEES